MKITAKATIRKFGPLDIDRILEIEKASFQRGSYSKKRIENLFESHPGDFIVAELADEIAGYLIAYNTNGVVDFDSLAVDEKYRETGIGKKLVCFTLNKFKKKGLKKASLEVRINNKRAISFFQGLGFKITKLFKRYYLDGEDAYKMEKLKL